MAIDTLVLCGNCGGASGTNCSILQGPQTGAPQHDAATVE